MSQVYLDYNSSTPPLPEALEGAKKALAEWGNPSSIHRSAKGAQGASLAVPPSAFPFSLLPSLGADLHLRRHRGQHTMPSKAFALPKREGERNEIIISSVEHVSVRETAQFLKTQGFKVLYAPVSRDGALDEGWFEGAFK